MADLETFDAIEPQPSRSTVPLAARMRPRTLDEVVGHHAVLSEGSPLRQLIAGKGARLSIVLWGPPGSGKTTLASLMASATGSRLLELSAVNAGVKDIRSVVSDAPQHFVATGQTTTLFIDEVHRFSKTQQDALLPAVEAGTISIIAATTENPHFSIVTPLLSRSLVITLEVLNDNDIALVVERALVDERGLGSKFHLDNDAKDHIIRLSGGDARRALTYLEASTSGAREDGVIDLATVERTIQRGAVRYDRAGDQHYDVTSAFIKSVRGSDPDGALHYLARMIEAGEDPRFIARRLIILANEDIGLADPTAFSAAVNAFHAVNLIGLPEARFALAQATVHLSLASKSNAIMIAMDSATADVRAGRAGEVPPHLRDAHYSGATSLGHGTAYRYPHDHPDGVVAQEYLPTAVKNRQYYRPSGRGVELRLVETLARVRSALGRS